jgi:hypothetical protein
MPIIVNRPRKRFALSTLDERITKMSLKELASYEKHLWTWMDKAGSPASIALRLNMIYREVEWRCSEFPTKTSNSG